MLSQTESIDLLVEISRNSSSINEDMFFSVLAEKYESIINKLNESSIDYEDMGGNTIQINKNFTDNCEIKTYCSKDSFYIKYEETTWIMLILGNQETDSLVSFIDNDNCIRFRQLKSGKIDQITTNFLYLKKIIKLLSEPRITDYKDTALNRYFFLSPECGKMEINEGENSNLIEISKSDVNIFEIYKKFTDMYEYQKGWEFILKNKIIKGLEGVDIPKIGFKELIINLPKFIDATERDYELFLNSRKHESIVQQFENEKYIFADKIRAILQRISNSIIAIPITFFGAAFTVKEISHLWLLNIIIMSMFFYIIFSCIINFLFWGDLDILKEEINKKTDILSMGLPRLHIALMEINKPLFRKIKCLKVLVICTIILFALLFLYFIFLYTNNPTTPTVSDHVS